jgi:hypothetical protein
MMTMEVGNARVEVSLGGSDASAVADAVATCAVVKSASPVVVSTEASVALICSFVSVAMLITSPSP